MTRTAMRTGIDHALTLATRALKGLVSKRRVCWGKITEVHAKDYQASKAAAGKGPFGSAPVAVSEFFVLGFVLWP